MKNKVQVIIVGAGPAGLYFGSLCEKANISYLIIEATDKIGGQLTRLYPEKEIVDIPGIESILAKDYIKYLCSQINLNNVILEERGLSLENNVLYTSDNSYEADHFIVCTGLGCTKPRTMGLDGEDGCKNIFYHLHDFSFLKNKRIAIFGGGDSALDWSKEASSITDYVSLIHRRREFRGNVDTIKDRKNITIYTPFVPHSLDIENGNAKNVSIQNVETNELTKIDVDYIMVNYGNLPCFSPLGLSANAFINVNNDYLVKNNVYCIGDAANYENKKRRIAPALSEANYVFNKLFNLF